MKSTNLKSNLLYTGLILTIVLITYFIVQENINKSKYDWYIYETEAYKIWDDSGGEGVIIAFLDTGMSNELIEVYSERVVSPFNIINNNNNVDDSNGHGTKVICASTCSYEDTGIYGIAPLASVMPIVVMDNNGRTSGEYMSEGIYYAVDNSADIINISSGSKLENQLVKDAVDYAELNGVIVIAAVGDYSEERVLFPARYSSVIAVQAQSKLGVEYKDSSYGNEVDILIPGEFIRTISYDNSTGLVEESYMSGSSVSTGIMSGIIALVLEKNESMGSIEIQKYIDEYDFSDKFLSIRKFLKQ